VCVEELGIAIVYVAMESSLSSAQLSGVQKDELMEQVKQQIAVANAQELLTVYHICYTEGNISEISFLMVVLSAKFKIYFSENDGKMFPEVYK
jgi:hypothetical protein